MLHYNFPPFSTGEVRPMRGTSRREIGHGNLAERAVAMARVAPDDQFAGLAEHERLARTFPDLDLLDPKLPSVAHRPPP